MQNMIALKSPLTRAVIAISITMLLLSSNALPPAHAAAGDLDLSFGGTGKITTDFFSNTDRASGVAIQSDGKIVAAGFTIVSLNSTDFALARYNTNGSLDTTFGTGGRVTTDFFGIVDTISDISIQADGKIVVAGCGGQFPTDFALARYNTDGSLDTTFGTGGRVTTDFFNQSDFAGALIIQSDGKIIAAGLAVNSNQLENFALARYNTDGSLDTTFGTGGKVTTSFGFNSRANDIAIQSNGKIVAVGTEANPVGSGDFALARYNSDGSLDSAFGTGGKVTTNLFGGSDLASSVAIQSDGRIIVAGIGETSLTDFALLRYNLDGSLDTTFGIGGKVTTDFFGSTETISGIVIQTDGKIVAAGFAFVVNASKNAFALARYNTDGSLDSAFGTGGKVTTELSTGEDFADAVALQADGKIVVVGSASSDTSSDFAIARYKPRRAEFQHSPR